MPRTVEFVVVSGWVLLLLTCFGVTLTVVYLSVQGMKVDPILKELAGPAFGFLFGSIPPMVKDLLKGGSP